MTTTDIKPYNKAYLGRELGEWALNGSPIPAPHPVKVLILAHLFGMSRYCRFIETGTLMGNTSGPISLLPGIKVDTIELSPDYFARSRERLKHRPNITQHFGDSTDVLPQILRDLNEPAIFWLDAHHSGGATARGNKSTPISDELEQILAHPIHDHIIAIDDMRAFTGKNDYPSALEVEEYALSNRPDVCFHIKHDIAIIAPTHIQLLLEQRPFRFADCPLIQT